MQNLFNRISLVVLVVGVTVLTGCTQQARRSIGLERTPPDEFLVDSQIPLVIPPEFGLRPPVPVSNSKLRANPEAQGMAALTKGNEPVTKSSKKDPGAPKSPSDIALLKAAGALSNTSNDTIRLEIDRDLRQKQPESPEMVKKLVSP